MMYQLGFPLQFTSLIEFFFFLRTFLIGLYYLQLIDIELNLFKIK